MQLPLRRSAGVQKKKKTTNIYTYSETREIAKNYREKPRLKALYVYFFFSFYDPIKSDVHSLDLILPLLPKTKPLTLYRTAIVLYS